MSGNPITVTIERTRGKRHARSAKYEFLNFADVLVSEKLADGTTEQHRVKDMVLANVNGKFTVEYPSDACVRRTPVEVTPEQIAALGLPAGTTIVAETPVLDDEGKQRYAARAIQHANRRSRELLTAAIRSAYVAWIASQKVADSEQSAIDAEVPASLEFVLDAEKDLALV